MTQRKPLNRRSFIAQASGVLATPPLIRNVVHAGQQVESCGSIMAAAIKPYDPLFKRRIVFTDWEQVNPGWFRWLDDAGRPRNLTESVEPGKLRLDPVDPASGFRLVVQPPQRVGPIIRPERPWEQMGVGLQTVFYENGVYRAWAVCNPELKENFGCYYESKDGLHWERPNLGLFEYQGRRDNNLLFRQGWNRHVFFDPIAVLAERYKMVTGDRGKVCGAVSADGLRWNELPGPIHEGPADTQNIACYDAKLKKYVLYHRLFRPGDIRAIGRSESQDFRHFPASHMALAATPDMPPSSDLYTICYTTMPGAHWTHLMFPVVYHRDRDLGSIALATSPDGRVWTFLNGAAPILGPAAEGQWDCGWLTATPNLIELPDGSFALPYIGQNTPHKYPRGQLKYATGYALWPRGRIIAVQAPRYGGFTTNPIDTYGGRELLVNAVTEPQGSIRVEVAGVGSRRFAECEPIVGDQYRKVVTWHGQHDLGHQGTSVVLRFQLEKAAIFELGFV